MRVSEICRCLEQKTQIYNTLYKHFYEGHDVSLDDKSCIFETLDWMAAIIGQMKVVTEDSEE